MTRILLVRHGESEWNARGRWQGQADPPLSERGRLQAAQAARAIGSVDAIASSTLERARHTAEAFSDEVGIGPVHTDARLMERDAAEWSGLTRAEIKRDWPGYLPEDDAVGRIERRPPGWEPDERLLERALAGLRDVVELAPGGEVVVVTHGGVMYAIEAMLEAPRLYIPNLGARWIEWDGARFVLGPRIELIDQDLSRRPPLGDQTAI